MYIEHIWYLFTGVMMCVYFQNSRLIDVLNRTSTQHLHSILDLRREKKMIDSIDDNFDLFGKYNVKTSIETRFYTIL